jgi:imidazole glycerol-phosphate synthase subunit HisH
MITIIDYGMGNLGSIANMLKKTGAESRITSSVQDIENATKLILPGVGAFDTAMTKINESGLREVLDRKVLEDKVPVLGICLGMQLLTQGSEEGSMPGLGWIPGMTRRFTATKGVKIPHMGWNIVTPATPCKLNEGFEEEDETRFYFVHSYAVQVDSPEHSIFRTNYILDFDSGIRKENIYGVQFHPEKSHRFGKKLLSNFVEL